MSWFSAHKAAVVVFLLALVPGLALTGTVHLLGERRAADAFARTADLAVDRVVSRVRQHVIALRASRGLWEAREGRITRDEFIRFLESVDLEAHLTGARGIGFAPMVRDTDMPAIEAAIREAYGIGLRPRVETDQPWRTPVVLLEPAGVTTQRALGYDMFSDPVRRDAMTAAIVSGEARATAPVTLVGSEVDGGTTGFLIFKPLSKAGAGSGEGSGAGSGAEAEAGDMPPVEGFVYAAFSGQDLIDAALASGPPLPVSVQVADAADPSRPLYRVREPGVGLSRQVTTEILGRNWVFDIRQTETAPVAQLRGETAVLGFLSVIFALAMAYAVSSRQAEAARARELAAAAGREAEYRELLVQEMKHRIKNHIARIQSIARQSARGAVDVKAFTDTFEARLRAMAMVQEVLAGTAQPQADVAAILRKELQQVLDTAEVTHLIDGPQVWLDERRAHAFGLVVHELVTNAMKYGGLSSSGQGLRVTWRDTAGADSRVLTLDWQERFDPVEPRPAGDGTGGGAAVASVAGFGSRLIEASLRGELSGSLTRTVGPGRYDVRITFPLGGPAAAKG